MTTENVRLGVVGVGGFAELAAAAARQSAAVELVACTSRRPGEADRFARRHNLRAHATFEGLLGDDAIDAVHIATPNVLHASQTLAALESGKHVLVEKPMALSVSDAVEMVNAAHRTSRVLGVGFHLRHSDVIRRLAEALKAGDVGQPRLLRAAWGINLRNVTGWKADGRAAGAGALMGLGVHILDLLLWLIDSDIDHVMRLTDAGPGEIEQTSIMAVRFRSGTVAEITVTRDGSPGSNSLELLGTEGSLRAEEAIAMSAAGRLIDTDGRVIVEAVNNPYAVQFDAFAEAIRGGGPFHASGADGLQCVELTQRMLDATPTG